MKTPTLQANGKQTGRPLGLAVHPAATACSITTAAGPSLPAGIPDPQFTVSEQARREAFASLDHAHHQVIAAETAELIGILHAAQLWDLTCDQIDASIERITRTEKLRAYGHDGTPHIGEFLALEIGPLLGISAHTACGLRRYMAGFCRSSVAASKHAGKRALRVRLTFRKPMGYWCIYNAVQRYDGRRRRAAAAHHW